MQAECKQGSSKVGRKKAPTGVDKRPVYARLMPDERAQLEQLAARAGLTEGAMMRHLFLLGLPHHAAVGPLAEPR